MENIKPREDALGMPQQLFILDWEDPGRFRAVGPTGVCSAAFDSEAAGRHAIQNMRGPSDEYRQKLLTQLPDYFIAIHVELPPSILRHLI